MREVPEGWEVASGRKLKNCGMVLRPLHKDNAFILYVGNCILRKGAYFFMNFNALKNTKVLAVCAMLAAMGALLKIFVVIDLSETLRITLTFIPVYLAAFLYGGAAGACVGIITDIVGSLLRGYSLNFAYTIPFIVLGILSALIFRLLCDRLHAKPWLGIGVSVLVCQLLCSVGINGLALTTLFYGFPKAVADLPFNLLKQCVYIPVYTALLVPILALFNKLLRRS